MRRALVLALSLLALAPAWAPAADHLMRVNEAMTSTGGDPSAQFVELLDTSPEAFPFGPYRVVVYDATGAKLGHTEVTPFHTTPMLIASDAANLPARDAELLTALPTTAGQVCFTGDGAAERRIHCLTYGCVTTFVSGVRASGAAPPDGQSLQRQADGTATLGAPTPRAVNVPGTAAAACPGASPPPPPPAGPPPPPPPPGPAPPPGPPPPPVADTTKPRITALRVNPSSFCVKRSPTCRTPGTRVRFRLSERADVTMEVFFLGATASKRRVKTIRLRGRRAGTHVVRYSGAGLRRGRYVLNVFAQDVARNVSRSVSTRFSVRR